MGVIADIFGYLLNALYMVFQNYGLAIIVFTIILRLLLLPITIKQQQTVQKSAKLQEQMKEIQEKYKNNQEKMNFEIMDLYKREKMNPFSGCLSGILQIFIILSVFFLVSSPLTHMKKVDESVIENYKQEIAQEGNGKSAYPEIQIIQKKAAEDENVFINMNFLGLDLSVVPTERLNDYRTYIIPGLYILSSIASIKMTTNMQAKNQKKKDEIIVQDNGEKKEEEFDAMAQMSKNMTIMMPIMSVSIAAIAPLGLALYWLVSNVLIIIERLVMNKIEQYKEAKANAE